MQRYADQTQQRYVRLKFADFLSVNSVGLPVDGSAADGPRPLRLSPLRLSPHRQGDSSQERARRNTSSEGKSEAKRDPHSESKNSEMKNVPYSEAKSESKNDPSSSSTSSSSSALSPASKPSSAGSSNTTSPTPGLSTTSDQSTPSRIANSSSKKQGIMAALSRISSLTTNVTKLARQVEEDDEVADRDSVLLTPVRTVLREANGRDSPDSPNFEIREQIWRKMDANSKISSALTSPTPVSRSSLGHSGTGAASGSKSLWRKFESGIPLERSPPVHGMSCSCATCATVPLLSLGECQVRVRCKDASQQLFDVYLSHPDTRELWRWFDKFKDIAVDDSL